jgi:signal transduction histidine kinase
MNFTPAFNHSIHLRTADFLTIACIGAGALIMLLSVLKTSKLRKMLVVGVNTLRWKWLTRFMVVFLIGYLIVILLILEGYQEPLLLVTGLVFLLGSFFVYLVVFSAKSDIVRIYESNELLMKRNTELHRINLELDQFAYRTSHDLKAPVASLQGLVKIAELSTSREEIAHCHALMKDSLSNLEELIRDILDLSKNSRAEVKYAMADVAAIVAQLVKSHVGIKGCPVQVSVDGPAPFEVYVDTTRFKMIVGNLLSNALQYADLSKKDPFIKIKFWNEKQFFCLSVSDNGVGIEAEYLEKIFGMFFRATEDSIGSGLGLYIVKEAAEKMGGNVEVISRKGEGSEFIVRLPHFVHARSEF